MKKEKRRMLILLHIILLMYSLGGICSKYAAKQEFLSHEFLFYYGIVLINLLLYAVLWQQILKKIPLVTAYANKAITVVWGLVWGFLFFEEPITIRKIVSSFIIIVGIYLVVSDKEDKKE